MEGRDRLGSFYIFFLQRELAVRSCHTFIVYLTLTSEEGTNAGGAMGEAFAADTVLCCSHAVVRACVCLQIPWDIQCCWKDTSACRTKQL